MVPTMMQVIWRELNKVWFESETTCGSENKFVMVGQYLWGTLKSHIVMNKFLRAQFKQNTEVTLHITIYLFEHLYPRVDVVVLRKSLERISVRWRKPVRN